MTSGTKVAKSQRSRHRRIRFDPEHYFVTGYYQCDECSAKFFDGGRADHNPGCLSFGFWECTYYVGWSLLQRLQKESQGDPFYEVSGVCLSDLEREVPELFTGFYGEYAPAPVREHLCRSSPFRLTWKLRVQLLVLSWKGLVYRMERHGCRQGNELHPDALLIGTPPWRKA